MSSDFLLLIFEIRIGHRCFYFTESYQFILNVLICVQWTASAVKKLAVLMMIFGVLLVGL